MHGCDCVSEEEKGGDRERNRERGMEGGHG